MLRSELLLTMMINRANEHKHGKCPYCGTYALCAPVNHSVDLPHRKAVNA